jgi:hypothetical protein
MVFISRVSRSVKMSQGCIMKRAIVLVLLADLVACSSTATLLEGVDVGCVRINVDGYFTDSSASGRAIKLPEGMPIDAATVQALCNE